MGKGGTSAAPVMPPPQQQAPDYSGFIAPILSMMETNNQIIQSLASRPPTFEMPVDAFSDYIPIDWASREKELGDIAKGIIAGENMKKKTRASTVHTSLIDDEDEEPKTAEEILQSGITGTMIV